MSETDSNFDVVVEVRRQGGSELGIVKFDEKGIKVVADRAVGPWAENRFVQTKIFGGNRKSKSLKFSACINGSYYGSFVRMLPSFEVASTDTRAEVADQIGNSVPFMPGNKIESAAQDALIRSGSGPGALVTLQTSAGPILSRITQRSVARLELGVGVDCFALLKTVSIGRDDVGFGFVGVLD